MFWRILDAGQPHYAAILYNTTMNDCKPKPDDNTNENDEFDINCLSDQFSHFMSMAIWAIYQLITVLLLINILIAMMNSTYTRIWEDSDRIFYYLVKYIHTVKRNRSNHSE